MPTVQALRGCSTEGRGQAYWGWHTSWAGVFWGGSGSLPTDRGRGGQGFAPRHSGSGAAPPASGPDTPCLFNVCTYGNLN